MYEGDIASVLISEDEIRRRTVELAEEIAKRYPVGAPEGDLLLVGVLKGAIF
ncbi:hypoxanthine phosphoribosyltransferase, partial [Rhodococcus sp. WS4]